MTDNTNFLISGTNDSFVVLTNVERDSSLSLQKPVDYFCKNLHYRSAITS